MPDQVTEETPILFLFHGFGSNKNNIMPLKDYFGQNQIIISVNATVEVKKGGWSWFEYEVKNGKAEYDIDHTKIIIKELNKFIDGKIKENGNTGDKVYALGFSQGAILIHSLLHTENTSLKGGITISGRILAAQYDEISNMDNVSKRPIFIAHGIHDKSISIDEARKMKSYYNKISKNVTYKEYDMGHSINGETIEDITSWIEVNINNQLIQPK